VKGHACSPHSLRIAASHGLERIRSLNEIAYPLVGFLYQYRARIGSPAARRLSPF
jgi:hypothetical protein